MANIHDYLRWRGDLAMEQARFNEVDALILAKLAYIPFARLPLTAASAPVAVRDAAASLLLLTDIEKAMHFKDDIALLRELAESRRFRDMRISDHVDRIEEENQTQFSATTVRMDERLYCIAFRGTDASLVGWKENFNMSFLFPVPAQKSAVRYLEEVMAGKEGNFIVCGHSKGGNLAMYAAAFCGRAFQDRIAAVYDFDGPGFGEKVLDTPEYRRVRDRMMTFVPQSSVVGLLLEHEEQYIIVKSAQTWIMQHDISSWEVERDHLCDLAQVTNASRFIDRTLKGWLVDMDVGQRERLVDALYSILAKTQARTLQELDDRWFECTVIILSTLSDLDEGTRKLIADALSLLIRNAQKSFRQMCELSALRERADAKPEDAPQ